MDTEYRRAANITIVIAGLFALAWLFFRFAISPLLPFLLAAMIAALVSPIAKKITEKTKIPRRITSAVILLITFSAVLWLIYAAVSRLIFELGELLRRLSENPEIIGDTVQGVLDRLTANGSHFSFLQKIFDSDALGRLGVDVNELFRNAISSMLSSLTSALPSAAVSLVKELPSALLFIVVFLIAAFYFSSEGGELGRGICSLLPEKWQKKLPLFGEKLKKTLVGYIKAYLLLMLLTFVEMLIGLTLVGAEYAFIMAIVISVVDVLPILGTGAVLVPWAIFEFLTSNTPLGVGLLVIYGVSLIIRQLAEPKIVGKTLGLHPLATLASVYIGLSLLGFSGLFIGPLTALLLRELFFKESGGESEKTETNDLIAK